MQIERNSVSSVSKLFDETNMTLTVLFILINQNLLHLPVWELNKKGPVV